MSKENEKKSIRYHDLSLSDLAKDHNLYSDLTSFLKFTDLLNLSFTSSFFNGKTKALLLKKIKNELTEKFTLANNKTIEESLKKADELTERFNSLVKTNDRSRENIASLLFEIVEQGFEKLFEKVCVYSLYQSVFNRDDIKSLQNKEGNLLTAAVKSGNIEIIKKLKERNLPTIPEQLINKNFSHHMSKAINKSASAIFGGGGNFNFFTPSSCGNTPFLIGAKLGYWDCVKELLLSKNDLDLIDEIESSTGNTLLHYAYKDGKDDIIKIIKDEYKNLYNKQKDKKNKKGETPLELAQKNNHDQFTFNR